MDRINGANWIDIGGGKRGFRDRNTVAGLPGTEVTAMFMNGVQEEILNVVESFGFEPEAADLSQLLKCFEIILFGHGAVALSAPGSGSWVVPEDVYLLMVETYGAAGGGACIADYWTAMGGSGGGYSLGFIEVNPGQSIPWVVGAGGAAGTLGDTAGSGAAGGTTSFGGVLGATGGDGGSAVWGVGSAGVGFGGALNLAGQAGEVGGSGVYAAAGGSGAGPHGGFGDQTSSLPGTWPGGGGSGFVDEATTSTTAGANGGIIIRY